jgi:hypothetical protein
MNTNQRYKLLDGTFTPAEAMQILLSLVKSKIDFHNLEKLSNEERFGRDVAHSERRLTELRELRETLRTVCQSAAETGQRVQVNGWIEITPVPPLAGTEPQSPAPQ